MKIHNPIRLNMIKTKHLLSMLFGVSYSGMSRYLPGVEDKDFLSHVDFVAFCWEHLISSDLAYREFRINAAAALFQTLPSQPHGYYTNWRQTGGWQSITGNFKDVSLRPILSVLPMDQFIIFCKEQNVYSQEDYRTRVMFLRPDLPVNPKHDYKNWPGWGVVTGYRSGIIKLPITKFIRFCKKHCVESPDDYKSRLYPKYLFLTSEPARYYKDKGWQGWFIITGKRTPAVRGYTPKLSLAAFITFCCKHGVVSRLDYLCRVYPLDAILPRHPNRVYKDSGWKNWGVITGKVIGRPLKSKRKVA